MANLSRSIEVTINQNVYTIKYPNVGLQMDMDILRMQMSGDKYDALKFSFNPSFQRQALILDAVATFNTLIPQLRKDLTVKSMFELEREQMDVIVKAYEEEFLPWYEEWNTALNKPKSEEKKDDK